MIGLCHIARRPTVHMSAEIPRAYMVPEPRSPRSYGDRSCYIDLAST